MRPKKATARVIESDGPGDGVESTNILDGGSLASTGGASTGGTRLVENRTFGANIGDVRLFGSLPDIRIGVHTRTDIPKGGKKKERWPGWSGYALNWFSTTIAQSGGHILAYLYDRFTRFGRTCFNQLSHPMVADGARRARR